MADVNSSKIIMDSFQAAETIPAFAAVSLTVDGMIVNTNWPDPVSVSNFLGIALTGGFAGSIIDICLFGVVTNPLWTFIPQKPVYLFYSGMLMQDVPDQVARKIGKALTSTKLFVAPSDLLMLSQ